MSSGLSLYCFAFTLDEIKQILDVLPEQLRQDGEASLAVIVPKDYSHRSIVMYPCRDKEIINFGAIVPNALLKETPTDSWTAEGKIEDMLEIFHDYPDWVKQLMGYVKTNKFNRTTQLTASGIVKLAIRSYSDATISTHFQIMHRDAFF